MKLGNNTQVFLLHFAGGNRYSFNFLRRFEPKGFDFHLMELPGRGKRVKEKLLTLELEAVDDLLNEIRTLRNDKPCVIFGHSMGARLALRITKKLEELGDNPKQLIVAGNAGPGTGDVNKRRSLMSDQELKGELRILGGVPNAVLENEDVFQFFSRIMRADFRIVEEAKPIGEDFKVKAPIVAVMGDQEETSKDIENWSNFTSSTFRFQILPGRHFFMLDHPEELVRIITHFDH